MAREKLPYDYSKLRGRIKEKYGNEVNFAENIGLKSNTLNNKLNSVSPIFISEMDVMIEKLNIPYDQIHSYFFTKKVENNSTDII